MTYPETGRQSFSKPKFMRYTFSHTLQPVVATGHILWGLDSATADQTTRSFGLRFGTRIPPSFQTLPE